MACAAPCVAVASAARPQQRRPVAVAARLRWPVVRPQRPPPQAPQQPQQPQQQQRRAAGQRRSAVLDRGSGGGGAGILDRPGLETLGPGGGPATDSAGSLDSSGGRGLGGGSWRVLLVDSDKHTEERCVDAITTGNFGMLQPSAAAAHPAAGLRYTSACQASPALPAPSCSCARHGRGACSKLLLHGELRQRVKAACMGSVCELLEGCSCGAASARHP